jgi:hypothetical protein
MHATTPCFRFSLTGDHHDNEFLIGPARHLTRRNISSSRLTSWPREAAAGPDHGSDNSGLKFPRITARDWVNADVVKEYLGINHVVAAVGAHCRYQRIPTCVSYPDLCRR